MVDVICDHDRNLGALLDRCEQRGIRLNPNKVQLRRKEVSFIGRVATSEGLCVDPAKIKAIKEIPDVATGCAEIARDDVVPQQIFASPSRFDTTITNTDAKRFT